VGVEVRDASIAYDNAVENGARGVLPPSVVRDFNEDGGGAREGTTTTTCRVAEVELYGDVVLRFVSFHDDGDDDDDDRSRDGGSSSPDRRRGRRRPFLPNLSPYPNDGRGGGGAGWRSDGGRGGGRRPRTYGLTRIDHAVGNVPDLLESLEYVGNITGYHLFAEFASEDVGTLDSGLNSVVLASDDESVLLPLNEPTNGRRKSQIQTYLEQNDGPGMQHIAIKTRDIFGTIRHMRHAEEELGGFELMARPSDAYYRELPSRLGERLSSDSASAAS